MLDALFRRAIFDGMTPEEHAARRRGTLGLVAAGAAITVLSLGPPLWVLAGRDLGPLRPVAALLWVVAIGGWLIWLRTYKRLRTARRAKQHDDPGDSV